MWAFCFSPFRVFVVILFLCFCVTVPRVDLLDIASLSLFEGNTEKFCSLLLHQLAKEHSS